MTRTPGAPLFVSLPNEAHLELAWPTVNHFLRTAPDRFFARTRVNADYGKPGWTRDCGRRAHFGCDIAPVNVTPTGRTTLVNFSDCDTGTEYPSEEPTFTPCDDVFAVFEGALHSRVDDENASHFGKHIVLKHQWPESGQSFFTVYAHLNECALRAPVVKRGDCIGLMGRTSSIPDMRNWMSIAPHLHFEVRDAAGDCYNPVEFLLRHVG